MDLLLAALFLLGIYQVSGLSVRLVGGNSSLEGRVEVFYLDEWGTICDDHFDENEAKVICHMLGYQRDGAIAYSKSRYGQGRGKIWLDNLFCDGNESSVSSCWRSNATWGYHDCTHYEDVGVRCISKYLIVSIKTGIMFGAGTDANVHVTLHGLNGETEGIRFNGSTGRDEVKEMRMEAKDILPIEYVEIGHDGSGIAAGWFLEYASVYVENMDEYYVFRYNGWVYEHNYVVLQREGGCINSFDDGQLWEPNWRAVGYTYIDMERSQHMSLIECKQACVIRGQRCYAIRYDSQSRRCIGFTRARFFTDFPLAHKTRKVPVYLRKCQ